MSKSHFSTLNSKSEPFFFNFTNIFSFPMIFFLWPKGISFLSWQNLLKSHLWFLGTSKGSGQSKAKNKRGPNPSITPSSVKERGESQTSAQQTESIINSIKLSDTKEVKLELITLLKKFWEAKHISQHIEATIPDYRNQDQVIYTKQSIMMAALSIFIFRMQSGNNYTIKSQDVDEKYSRANIAKFIDAPEKRVPVIRTIEKFLKNLDEDSINDLMISYFKDLQKSKFFHQHPQLMLGDFFLLAADCVHTHTYLRPHHHDNNGNNTCDCCLKRTHNKGTDKEKTLWVHNTLVLSFVFFGGLKIPIYRYPIHAKQLVGFEDASEDKYKQECELVALKMVLPKIREQLSRMKIVLLLDGLYSNRPTIRLAQDCRCGYIIVRKEACLSTLGKECDEHAASDNHKKNCVKNSQYQEGELLTKRKYSWFNSMYLGEGVSTNVLRFSEKKFKKNKEVSSYKCEWLFSWRLSSRTCELAVKQARARWEVEDLFNTMKNRNFNLNHDYSRDPRACFNWQALALFAFGIFELFRFSEAVKQRGTWTQTALAEKLLGQLLHFLTDKIFSKEALLKKLQFRYIFSSLRESVQHFEEGNANLGWNTG